MSDRKLPSSILARLVFCQVLSDSAHCPPPDSCYLPSLSFHPRQHQEAFHCWAVSSHRPTVFPYTTLFRSSTALLEQYENKPYAVSSRLRFVLKRRLHQDSIEPQPTLRGSLSTEWCSRLGRGIPRPL